MKPLELDIIKLLQKDELIDFSIKQLLTIPKYLDAMLQIQPVSILSFNKEDYLKLLKEHHLAVYSDLLKKYINQELDHELSLEAFKRKYGSKWLLLSSIYRGQLSQFLEFELKDKPIITVEKHTQSAQFQLAQLTTIKENYEKELVRKDRKIKQLQQKYDDVQKRVASLQLKAQQIQETQVFLQTIQEENTFLKKKQLLIGQELILIGLDWHEEVIEEVKTAYYLSKLTCYSAIEQIQKIDNLQNKLVIFSSSQARHQAFYKLKQNKSLSLFMTKESNANLVMKQFVMSLKDMN